MFVCGECGWAQPTAGRCNDGTILSPIGDDLLLGTSLGPYRIARLLGVGGMGRVYKGVHPQIGSRVAIKVLSRECTDRPDLVERFFAEARAVNLVSHEGIVNVLDLSVLGDGRPYIIMEYLDGAPLSGIIDQARSSGQPLPVGTVARLAVEVLDALGAAHAKGIVHRDLKPDNIFITPGGRPKVLDFGIAKLVPELGGNSATHTGSLLGTPQYMAPEQASGRVVDARADLYAMGCILYECMTLQRPFHADSLFELLRMQIHEPVRPPRLLRPDLPPDVEHVILIALAKQPDDRFGSASAMSQALQHATARLPPEQWAPVTPSGSAPPVRSNPSWGARQAPSPPPALPPMRAHTPTGNAATVPAPGSTLPPRAGSKAWLWAIVGGVVVGGSVAAALYATRTDAVVAAAPPAAPGVAALPTVSAPAPAPAGPAAPAAPPAPPAPVVTPQAAPATPPPDAPAAAAVAARPEPSEAPADELHTATGWVVTHQLRPPAGYDPKAVDVAAFLAFAQAEARRAMPDAQLVRFDSENVDATGHADTTANTHLGFPGTVDVRFISPSHMPANPTAAKPFGYHWTCEFRVTTTDDGVELREMDFPCTMDPPVRAPRCPLSDIWKRAAAKIPPGKRVDLDYRMLGRGGAPTWDVDIFGELEASYRDDCN